MCFKNMTKVKICGITNLEDALLSAKFGADALGFNFYGKSPRYIAPEKAREIIEQLPEKILKVGVFVNENLEKIIEIAKAAKLDALQLHGEESPEYACELKQKTNLEIIKAFRVSPDFAPEDVLKYETDAVLLDAHSPKEHGGTGETFDWEIAKKVQEIFPKMYLAGGLTHENISRAIYKTKSFAVDICSGVEETKGRKDRVQLINFLTKTKTNLKDAPINFYNFLSAIHQRPLMYLNKKSLIDFNNLLYGFKMALKLSESHFNTGFFFTDEIRSSAEIFFNERIPGAMGLHTFILNKYKNDEEKSFDAFFAFLEEFKLEKENLENE